MVSDAICRCDSGAAPHSSHLFALHTLVARCETAVAPVVAARDLTAIRYFDKIRNMPLKTVLPLARLDATPQHVEAFKALAHLTRLQVFFFLVRAGKEVAAGDIQEAVEVPAPTLSHHLDVLRRAGLVQSRREERYVYYAVRRDTATTLVRLLTAGC